MLQRVEYEALHVVCFKCGSVGHRNKDCPANAINTKHVAPVEGAEEGTNMESEIQTVSTNTTMEIGDYIENKQPG